MLDLPGHGLSDGRRSNIDHFSDYVLVFEDFFQSLKSFLVEAPYIGFGHSLGGLILLRFLQTSNFSKELYILGSSLFLI
jgi:lysophospholipase